MEGNDTIQELRDLKSILCDVSRGNIFTVPTGYFDGFAVFVLNRIKAINASNAQEELNYLSPVLTSASKQVPYSAPEGYFNTLPESLLTAVREHEDYQTADEELSSLSPLLSGISKENPYAIPEGYFENFGKDVNLKSENRPVVKTFSIVSRQWFRFAAAAVVIGFIAITGVTLFFRGSVSVTNPHEWVKANMKKVSTDDINTFIQPADEQSSVAVTSAKTEDIKELMKDVSDKDIQNFLNETTVAEDNNEDLLLN